MLALVLLAAVLTPTHPNHKARMLHSWLPALWVTAGLGAAVLWGPQELTTESQRTQRKHRRNRKKHSKRPNSGFLSCSSVFLFLCVFLCVLCDSVVSSSSLLGHAVEGGPHAEQPSMLDVPDAYLADLEGGGRTLLLTSLPLKPMAQWTWLERFGSFKDSGGAPVWFRADNRRGFTDWLRTTDCATLVFCETTISREGVDSGPECRLHAELKDILSEQQIFHLVQQRDLPHLACRVQIWRR